MTFPEHMAAEGWEKIGMGELVRRTNLRRGAKTRLEWVNELVKGKRELFLVNNIGERWRFRAQRGAWIRKENRA